MIGLFFFFEIVRFHFLLRASPSGIASHAGGTGNQVVEPEEVDIGIPGDRVDSKRGG